MRAVLALTLAVSVLSAPPRAEQAGAPATAQVSAVSSKVWLGREAEFEAFLKTAAVDHEAAIPVGVTKPRHIFFVPGGIAASAVFKPLQPGRTAGFFESYKSEIAAYELDKVLGLGMVPPTVERRLGHDVGSLQLWVEHVAPLKGKNPNEAPSVSEWNRQVHRQRVWDGLTANIDRNAGNLLVDPAWNLILIDHSRAFTTDTRFPFPITRIDRELLDKLKALDEATIRARLGHLLFDGPKPLLKRRDLIVAQIDRLVREKGEAAVILP
jgi:hypothetical protein